MGRSFRAIVVALSHLFLLSSALQRQTSTFNSFAKRLSTSKIFTNGRNSIDVDIAVIGGGIAGSTISWYLQEQKYCRVALIDPRVNVPASWYPNYGEWRDEWHVLSDRLQLPEMKTCTTTEWETTHCFFGGSYDIPDDYRLKLPRPYIRVDRIKLQSLMRNRFSKAGGVAISSKVLGKRIGDNLFSSGIVHTNEGSTLTLENGQEVKCKILVDATGPESRFIVQETPTFARASDKSLDMGFQIAYGFIAVVDNLGPYDFKAMTLFDYRTTYLEGELSDKIPAYSDRPTFMYVMPLSAQADGTFRVFFEETSLVGRDERRLSFAECKERAQQRLGYHGINILGVEEEEYCYIPMGGELPDARQRIIAFGGAANLVHPSTGYQVCRMLAACPDVADTIAEGVKQDFPPDMVAVNAYNAMWGEQNRKQRDFQVFGGEFLMAQPLHKLRGFFNAFFALDQLLWAGFLAGWPGMPGNELHDRWQKRVAFALNLVTKMNFEVTMTMILFSIKHTLIFGPNVVLRSLLPGFLFSSPRDPAYTTPGGPVGDEDVKAEARAMMKEFTPTAGEHSVTTGGSTSSSASAYSVEVNQDENSFVYPAPF